MAAGTVGVLNVMLKASTRGFTAGMRRAGKTVHTFTERIRTATGGLRGLGIGLGGILSVRALTGMIRETVRLGDSLAKTASKLGISAEGLSAMQYAAKRSGLETRTFNMALQRMARRMAEAAAGTGEAKQALQELRIDAGKMQKLGTEKSLYAVAKAFERIKNPMMRLRYAFKLFDSEGVAMVNLLNQGESGMRNLTKRAEELGIVVSRMDLASLEAISDAWAGVGMALSGLKMRAVSTHGPFVTLLGNLTADIIAAIDRNGPAENKYSVPEAFTLTLAKALDVGESALDKLVSKLPVAVQAGIRGITGIGAGPKKFESMQASLWREEAKAVSLARQANDEIQALMDAEGGQKRTPSARLRSARELGMVAGMPLTTPAATLGKKLDEERNKKLQTLIDLVRRPPYKLGLAG